MSGVGIHPGSLPGSLPFHLGGAFPVIIVGQSSPTDPPRNFLLDDDHDLVITSNLAMVAGLSAIAQDINCALLCIATFDDDGNPDGEWFLNREIGIPWFRDVFIKNPSLPRIQEMIRRAVLARPGVNGVSSLVLKFNRPARDLSMDYVASTDLGELVSTARSPA